MTIVDPERLAQAGLSLHHDGPVLTVTLDKPAKRNSQTPAMWHALAEIGSGRARRGACRGPGGRR